MKFDAVTQLTEDQAREYLEKIRWPNGPVCPHCQATEVTKLQGKSTRPGVYKCKYKTCRKQFTVTVGTVFERSHVSLRHWVIAFHMMCASKKGISAHQLHRMLDVTYKTAWFICHRVRYAMAHGPDVPREPLKGVVEADETYVGGKPRAGSKRGRGTSKTPVVALVERGGNVRAVVMPKLTAKNLKAYMVANIDKEATLMTDELGTYTKIGRNFARHGRIKHSMNIYAVGDVTTNAVEGFFALLKRGVNGTFHHVGKQHLQRYVDEFTFRWGNRKVSDSARRDAAVLAADGKRLMYR